AEDVAIAGHALWPNTAFFQGLEQGAARFAVVLAVAEAALPKQIIEFNEPRFHVGAADVAKAKLTDAGRVDQFAAAGKVEQPCGGGGVGALAGHFRQRSDAGVDTG